MVNWCVKSSHSIHSAYVWYLVKKLILLCNKHGAHKPRLGSLPLCCTSVNKWYLFQFPVMLSCLYSYWSIIILLSSDLLFILRLIIIALVWNHANLYWYSNKSFFNWIIILIWFFLINIHSPWQMACLCSMEVVGLVCVFRNYRKGFGKGRYLAFKWNLEPSLELLVGCLSEVSHRHDHFNCILNGMLGNNKLLPLNLKNLFKLKTTGLIIIMIIKGISHFLKLQCRGISF